MIIFQFSCIRW